MKALTIQQPWASMIASGEKWVENRTWRTNYRGPMAIHAGLGSKYLKKKELADYDTGSVVAVAWLSASFNLSIAKSLDWSGSRQEGCSYTFGEIIAHKYSEGPVCWVLEAVTKLSKPIPCKGAQGLWVLPAEIETLIWLDLAESDLATKLKGVQS